MARTSWILLAARVATVWAWSGAIVGKAGGGAPPPDDRQFQAGNAAPAPTRPSSSAATQTGAPANPGPFPMSMLPPAQTDETAGKGADLSAIGHSPREGCPYLGPKDAAVIVNVFSDFQCPVCKRSADPIKQLILDFPDGSVKVVFRNNALSMHPRAQAAALAALAAGKQGKFWQYHDRLFASQGALDDASLKRTAQKDIADPKTLERLKSEAAAAVKLGATGTPGIFVNGVRERGWGSYAGLRAMVERELAKGKDLAAAGTPARELPAARIRATAATNPKDPNETPIDPELWVRILTAD